MKTMRKVYGTCSSRCTLLAFAALLVSGITPALAQEVWVTQFGPGTAKKLSVDGDSGIVTASVNLSKTGPEGCVCDKRGRVYVDENDSNLTGRTSIIERIETNLSLTKINDSILGPEGPSLDAAGNLYTNTRGVPYTHTGVWRFSAGSLESPPNQNPTHAVIPFTTFGEGTALLTTGLHSGQLVAVAAGGTVAPGVYRANASGTMATAALFIATPLKFPVGIAVSPTTEPHINAGDIVVCFFDGHVERYDPSSGATLDSAYATGLGSDSEYCAFDNGGNLYVANFNAGKIWKVHPDKTKMVINDNIPKAVGITVCTGCREDDGEGEIEGKRGGKASLRFHKDVCNEQADTERFSDPGEGVDFQGDHVISVTHNDAAHTVTIVGLGTNNRLPVAFTILAMDSTLTPPGMFSITLSDGYINSGNLLTGSIRLIP
jgi:prepilin-type processing-associated H-X9-DG protein